MEGWIKLYRKLLSCPVSEDPVRLAIWVYLLLSAAHETCRVQIGKQNVPLRPGQLITSRRAIARRFGISESKVRKTLDLFEKERQIGQQCSTHGRVITILRWDAYQLPGRRDVPPPAEDSGGGFGQFWAAYPKKTGKGYARRCWDRLAPGEALTEQILSALAAAKGSPQWNRDGGRYIPNPSTWLNQGRWNDVCEAGIDAEVRALRYLAEKRAARERELFARQEALRAQSPAFLENEKALRLCASRAARGRGAHRERAEGERQRLLDDRAEILRALCKPPDWLEDKPDCPLCGDRGYVGTQKCRCLIRLLGG